MLDRRTESDHNCRHPEDAIFVRIGLSAGEPIEEQGNFFGHAVQLAARLCALAQPDQILASSIIRDFAPDANLLFEELGPTRLKGFDEEVQVCAILLSGD